MISETVTAAATHKMTLAATVQTELGETGIETVLDPMISQASDFIRRYCDRDFARQRVKEELKSYGTMNLMVSGTPVQLLHGITQISDATTVPTSDYTLSDDRAGLIRRKDGTWDWSAARAFGPLERPIAGSEIPAYEVEYTSGYLMPGDDVSSSAISVSDTDDSFNGTNFPLLVAGDSIVTSGFTNSENNGTFTVVSRTSTKIVVGSGGTLTTEGAGQAVTMTVRTLPYDLERACIDLVKGYYLQSKKDPGVESESAPDIGSAKYTVGNLPAAVTNILSAWKRPVF